MEDEGVADLSNIPTQGEVLIDLTTPEIENLSVPDLTIMNTKYTITKEDDDWLKNLIEDPWKSSKPSTTEERRVPLTYTQPRPIPPWEKPDAAAKPGPSTKPKVVDPWTLPTKKQPSPVYLPPTSNPELSPELPEYLVDLANKGQRLPPWEIKHAFKKIMKTIRIDEEEFVILDELRE